MTDARLPDKWLGDPKFDEWQPETWKFFIDCLMWSNRYGTDGRISMLHLQKLAYGWDTDFMLGQLKSAKICVVSRHEVQFDWIELGQSLAADVEDRRLKNRQKQQAYRDKQTTAKETSSSSDSVTGDVTADVGQGRLGQDDTF
jgi:hypothetical protein